MKPKIDPKIRIRNKKELIARKKNFLKIVNILDKNNIFFFLQGGVLLGARREKNFIKWDWDIEISLISDELINKFDLIKKNIEINGFKILNCNKTHYTPKISFIRKKDKSTYYSLIGWRYNFLNKSYTRRKLKIPEKFLKRFSKIKFLNRKFNCPSPIDEYLTHQYGEWKKPLRSKNKSEYLSSSFYHKTDDYYNLIDKIMHLFKKYLT